MKLIAIKNHYINKRGSKKIKVLTKGLSYNVNKFGYSDYQVANYDDHMNGDIKIIIVNKSYFSNISDYRNHKLKQLGI